MKRARASACLIGLLAAARSECQTSSPSQDALDLQARSNVVQGAGARAFGMGGAFLARPDDATAASWNPAGLSYLRLPEFSAVGAFNSLRRITYGPSGDVTEIDKGSGGWPDFLAATYPIELGSTAGALQLSYQRVINFSGNRTITRGSIVREFETDGGFDVVALGSGLQLTRKARLGFAVNRWLNGYGFTQDRVTQNRGRSRQTLDFGASGWNVNVGAIFSPVEELNLGAVFKSGFAQEVALARSRTDTTTTDAGATVSSSNSASRDDVRLDFPAAFGVGASWRPTPPLTLSADYTRTNWSKGRIFRYFTLPITGAPQDYDALLYPTLQAAPAQRDTEQFRVGLEYVAIGRRLKWPLRVGYFKDRQLFLAFDGRTGSTDRPPIYYGLTLGTGVLVGRLLFDVAYVFERGAYREVEPDVLGTFRGNSVRSHRFFLSMIYRHKR